MEIRINLKILNSVVKILRPLNESRVRCVYRELCTLLSSVPSYFGCQFHSRCQLLRLVRHLPRHFANNSFNVSSTPGTPAYSIQIKMSSPPSLLDIFLLSRIRRLRMFGHDGSSGLIESLVGGWSYIPLEISGEVLDSFSVVGRRVEVNPSHRQVETHYNHLVPSVCLVMET